MMSSIVDPAKLKVVELRAELSKRGLETKGNKAVLVKRLKEALEEEHQQEIPDTSIADTSTEDLDSSQISIESSATETKVPENDAPSEEPTDKMDVTEEELARNEDNKEESEPIEEEEEDSSQPSLTNETPESTVVPEVPTITEIDDAKESDPLTETTESSAKDAPPIIEEPSENPLEDDDVEKVEKVENGNTKIEELLEKEEDDKEEKQDESEVAVEEETKVEENVSEEKAVEKTDESVTTKIDDVKIGEKRRRDKDSASPEKHARRRSRSPIKEDEPTIDNEKVQLSWYDSDLHLQVDKETFLSAKPYHDGAFGLAWAGVRATHGFSAGKVWYEVKLIEELQWDDFTKDEIREKERRRSRSRQRTREKSENAEMDNNANEKKTSDDALEEKTTETELEVEKDAKIDEEVVAEAEKMDVEDEEKLEEKTPEGIVANLFRMGWSLPSTPLQLGEHEHSYGYESTGKFVTNNEFRDCGKPYGVGDVIASFLHISEDNISINFMVNGELQEETITVSRDKLPENFALFPHLLTRNFAFELNFGDKDKEWFDKPEGFDDYVLMAKSTNTISGVKRPENRSDCEVILMCGLPASGKTYWIKEYLQSNPDKLYTVIGDTHLLEKMTVSGSPLKTNYPGKWTGLMDRIQKCLTKLIEIAALRRRNYIIDQPNVYPSAQRRKLRPFEGFKRRAVVVVIGDEEQAKRQSLQEAQAGNEIPDSTMLELKANMSLPQKCDWIDEVIFAELDENEAKTIVEKYNTVGRNAGYGSQKKFSHRDDRSSRWNPSRRNDYRRGGNYRDRNYHSNRYERGPQRQGGGNWHHQRSGGGGWGNRDRRDHRGPPPQSMGRDYRNRQGGGGGGGGGGGVRDRNRDSHQSGGGYNNRNRNQRPNGPWQSGNNWNQGGWNNPAWSNQNTWSGDGAWNNGGQNQWKYGGGGSGSSSGGGGQNYGGGYSSNWSYYGGQFPQNWGGQGQSASNPSQYQAWAQYAQQFAQSGGPNTTSANSQSTPNTK